MEQPSDSATECQRKEHWAHRRCLTCEVCSADVDQLEPGAVHTDLSC
jgi:hypothetical protein